MASEADIAHWKDAEKRVTELEKENARLVEALERLRAVFTRRAVSPEDFEAIEIARLAVLSPPLGGAVPKGLSKEKSTVSTKRKVKPDPVILQMRLSQVRELVSRLSAVHSEFRHLGWAHCKCDLAAILRESSNSIAKHLGLKSYRVEVVDAQ